MKKLIVMSVLLLLAAVCFTAVAGETSSTPQPTQIRVVRGIAGGAGGTGGIAGLSGGGTAAGGADITVARYN